MLHEGLPYEHICQKNVPILSHCDYSFCATEQKGKSKPQHYKCWEALTRSLIEEAARTIFARVHISVETKGRFQSICCKISQLTQLENISDLDKT